MTKITREFLQKQVFGGLRQYSSATEPKKGGNKLLLATLIGAGVAGGIAYNSSQTKVVPAAAKGDDKAVVQGGNPSAFSSDAFVPLKVIELKEKKGEA